VENKIRDVMSCPHHHVTQIGDSDAEKHFELIPDMMLGVAVYANSCL
jgi:hypothetical protein